MKNEGRYLINGKNFGAELGRRGGEQLEALCILANYVMTFQKPSTCWEGKAVCGTNLGLQERIFFFNRKFEHVFLL